MKIKGQTIKPPKSELLVFPREEGQDLAFKISAVFDYSEFEALCPEPQPPAKLTADGEKSIDLEDKTYILQRNEWYSRRLTWMYLKSITPPTPDSWEWETVNLSDPETWNRYLEELKAAFLTPGQINHLLNRVMKMNSIDEDRMKEARERFLTMNQSAPIPVQVSRKEEPSSTPSGEPASVSV